MGAKIKNKSFKKFAFKKFNFRKNEKKLPKDNKTKKSILTRFGFKNSLATRLIVNFSIMVAIALITLGLFSIVQASKNFENNIMVTGSQVLKEIDNGFSQQFNIQSAQVNTLSKCSILQNMENKSESIQAVQNLLMASGSTSDDVINVCYVTDSGLKVSQMKEEKVSKGEIESKDWYKNAKESTDSTIFTNSKDDATGKEVIRISRSVLNGSDFKGVVYLDVTLANFETYAQSTKIFNKGYMLVCDDNGNILFNNKNNKLKKLNTLSIWDKIKNKNSGSFKTKINGETSYVLSVMNSQTKWRIVGIVPGDEVDDNMQGIKISIVITTFIFIVICIILSVAIAKNLVKKMKLFSEAFARIAEGDFTKKVKVSSKDEFGILADKYNNMLDSVCEILKSVSNISEELSAKTESMTSMTAETTSAVNEVSTAIVNVATGASDQSASTQSVVDSINNLSSKITEINNDTNNINIKSENAKSLGHKGLDMVNKLIDRCNSTKQNAMDVANIVEGMTESIKKVNVMSEAIAQITEQTNLLSLNASIEAARAGEAGRGFSVVAEEIRNLADQSKKSTDDIKQILKEINVNVVNTKAVMEQSVSIVDEQNSVVYETKSVFDDIMNSLSSLADELSSINDLTSEIDLENNTVKKKIDDVFEVSQNTAAISEEVSASTEEVDATINQLSEYAKNLQARSKELDDKIARFKVN